MYSSPQRFPSLNPGRSGCLLVYSEWAALPVLLHPVPPRSPACATKRDGPTQRRVFRQRSEAAERGVWLGCRDSQPASRLMSWDWCDWLVSHVDGLLNRWLQQVSSLKGKSDNCAKKQPSDTVVITFPPYTALISSEVQRENVNEASRRCSLSCCRCSTTSDRSFALGDMQSQCGCFLLCEGTDIYCMQMLCLLFLLFLHFLKKYHIHTWHYFAGLNYSTFSFRLVLNTWGFYTD